MKRAHAALYAIDGQLQTTEKRIPFVLFELRGCSVPECSVLRVVKRNRSRCRNSLRMAAPGAHKPKAIAESLPRDE